MNAWARRLVVVAAAVAIAWIAYDLATRMEPPPAPAGPMPRVERGDGVSRAGRTRRKNKRGAHG